MHDPAQTNALAQLLDWYRAMGVGDLVAEQATDWFENPNRVPGAAFAMPGAGPMAMSGPVPDAAPRADPPARTPASVAGSPRPTAPAERAPQPARARPAAPSPVSPDGPTRQFAGTSPDAAVMAARTQAQRAQSLEDLAAMLDRFDGCSLKATAKHLVFYRGSARARVMFVGEAPGRDEDQEGVPFVGRAGQLLDKMLAAVALGEADVHITNIVYWRPPGNRTPTPLEAQVCRPFLERQVELVAPEIIVPLGGAAAKHLLDATEGIMKLRGRLTPLTVGRHASRALPTLHPAFLLRTPGAKRQAWRDLLTVRALLDDGSDEART